MKCQVAGCASSCSWASLIDESIIIVIVAEFGDERVLTCSLHASDAERVGANLKFEVCRKDIVK